MGGNGRPDERRSVILDSMLTNGANPCTISSSCAMELNEWSRPVKGSGNIVSEVRDISGFDAVELKSIGMVTIEQGDREGVEITADDNLLPEITTEVKNRR